MAFLFSSLKSPFVILKVPLCLCLCRQLAAALLKIAGGGNRSAPHIKNRKGSTGVNNACERIPLPPAREFAGGLAPGRGPRDQGGSEPRFAGAWAKGHPTNCSSLLSLPWAGRDEEKRRWDQHSGMQIRRLICRHKLKCHSGPRQRRA